MRINPILRCDSYKLSHFNQYPAGTQYVSSYIESRGGEFDETVFFGLQAFIKEYLLQPFTITDIRGAAIIAKAHGVPFNEQGWIHMWEKHYGFFPVKIEAVPEGTVMAPHNVQLQVVNTDPEFPWITSYIETALLRAIWYPSTVASLSRKMKGFIYQGLVQTSDDPDGQIGFKLHDFGARGATSSEAAMLGGMAHLVNFMGTDTLEGVLGAHHYYNASVSGFSIPATEHSTITSWGRDHEVDAYRNLLDKNPTGLVACVSDSYDIFNAVKNIWGGVLKDQVMARDGTLVIRPDSGNPTSIPLDIIELAMECFGYTVNSKGFRVLPPQVRVIQGDGMDAQSIPTLINAAYERKISVDNFAMGMGGGLLQKVNRDTMKYAMKASAVCINGKWEDVYKDPITDSGKRSKRGRLALILNDNGQYQTVREDELIDKSKNILRPVYTTGRLRVDDNFDNIRQRAKL